jgi:DNA-binding transcriptional ArsR family regulator
MVIEHAAEFDDRRTMGERMDVVTGESVKAGGGVHFLAHPERHELDLAAVLHALSDPMRLRIVRELALKGGERTCSSFNLPIVKSTCTHHFKVLREAGLIRQRVVGTKRVSSLRREDLDVRFPGLLAAVVHGTEDSPGVFAAGK